MDAKHRALAALAIFRNRNFVTLWSALLITEFGSAITQVTSFLLVFRLTGSVFSTGLMMAATIAPSLLFGLLAGVTVDRLDRRRIMVTADIVRAVLIGAIPLLLPGNIAWLYVLIMASASLSQFFNPAFYSVLPDITSDDELGPANSLLSVSQYGAIALGSAVAGLLVAYWPVEIAYFIDAATFLASATLIARVHVPSVPFPIAATQSIRDNVGSGLRYVAGKPVLRSLFMVFVPVGIAYGFSDVIRLPFVIAGLGASEADYGLLESLSVVGMVGAGLLMTLYSRRLRDGQWVVASFVGVGLTSIAFAYSPTIGLVLFFGMIEGFMYAPAGIASSLIIERNTPRAMRGRAFSAFFVARDSVFLIGMLLAGLGDLFDLRPLYLLSGLVVLVTGVVAHFLPGLGVPVDKWLSSQVLAARGAGQVDLTGARPLAPSEFGRLDRLVPSMATFSPTILSRLRAESQLVDLTTGTAIIRQDDASDAAYFVLDGSVTAMRQMGNDHEILEVLVAGDFFGEIAALTGMRRTADVVAAEPTAVITLPADLWREMAIQPGFAQLVNTTVNVRLARLGGCDAALPGRIDYQSLRPTRDMATVD